MGEERKSPGGGGGGKGPRRPGGGGGSGGGGFRKFVFRRKKVCKFCAEHLEYIDYKDYKLLGTFIKERGKILPRRISGTCAIHQRRLTTAIKRSRVLALLPFVAD